MDNKYVLLKGTLLLTGAGFITKIIGFIYRIFLSQTIGAEGMGNLSADLSHPYALLRFVCRGDPDRDLPVYCCQGVFER